MALYYISFPTKSQAFLMERRLKIEGIACELTYMPRELMTDLCSMGVRFDESEYAKAINGIRRSGLPGCKLYKEFMSSRGSRYVEERI